MTWLRDPIVLFLLLGGGLGALHLATRPTPIEIRRDTQIVVTDADVLWLSEVYEKTWRRPPTPAELTQLVEHRVRSEMLYREAVALGLDEGDEALRRRVAMKLEYLAKDVGGAAEPTDADLIAYLEAHPDTFRIEPRRRFTHVYLSTDRRGEQAAADAVALLATLRAKPDTDPTTLGDSILLESDQPWSTPTAVERQFGRDFAAALFAADTAGWQGPLRSGYGLHLVRIDGATSGGAAALDGVRDRVRNEWIDWRRTEALEGYVEALRKKYDVEIRTTLLEGTRGE